MSGGQCVTTSGALLMLKWLADSWDSQAQVCNIICYIDYRMFIGTIYIPQVLLLCSLVSPMVLDRSGWTMSSVVELRPHSSAALGMHWGATTVHTLKMPE